MVIGITVIAITIVILVYVALQLYLYHNREAYFYYPSRDLLAAVPKSFILPNTGTHIASIGRPGLRKTLVYCHGCCGNISWYVDTAKELSDLYGYRIVLYDYPQYGASGNHTPLSEEGIYACADEVMKWVLSNTDRNNIVMFGESMGGAVALRAALKYRIPRVILLGCPYSFKDLGMSVFPWWYWGAVHFIKEFPANEYLKQYLTQVHEGQVLIMHSSEDNVVPYEQGQRLYKCGLEADTTPEEERRWVGNRVHFLTIEGAHNEPKIPWSQLKI